MAKDYKEKKAELSSNRVVKKPLPRLDRDLVSKRGRKKKFTPTTMRNKINKYFKWCEDEDEIPSIKGLTIFLKIYKDQFYKYLKYPEFTDMLEHARLIISNWAEEDVYNTKGMAAGKIAYMKNVHAWSEKIESKSEINQTVLTVDAAKAKIEMLAPQLLELLESAKVVEQVGETAEVENAGSKNN